MISLDIKQSSSTDTSTLTLLPKDEKPTLSFASLLNAVGSAKKDEETKNIPNGVITLVLDDTKESNTETSTKESKKTDILSLLKNDKKISTKNDEEVLELNPKITTEMSPDELKIVINKAKTYLKNQIISSDGFKKQEIDSLPKTLKGLTQVAKNIGIDISKITLEKVQEQPVEFKMQLTKTTSIKLSKNTSELKIKSQDPEHKGVKITDIPTDAVDVKMRSKQKALNLDRNILEQSENEEQKFTIKNKSKNLKETSLFSTQVKTEITTEELVNAKAITVKPKDNKTKVKNTLQLLLRGERDLDTPNKSSILTADFSVATAKVIAPTATLKTVNSLASLLQDGDTKSDDVKSKTDGLNITKADSFEVKLNEAKQMVKYLSQDVKQALDNYKSPFTRVKVQLNPQQLGEIELTVVQRGKNLHVNLASNNTAINTLAMNANDLKVQLQNSGIQNASLSFSNNSQSGDQAAPQQHQQHQQNRQNAQSEYNYFENEEQNEEILSSLEIIVPNYA